MTAIEWNQPGERLFETGIDQVVLYPPALPGVPWNGVTAVEEEVSGGEVTPLYKDGVKYADYIAAEEYSANLTAFATPKEFMPYDGLVQLSPGLFATGQPRRGHFGLSYRTLIGNDLEGEDFAYKRHLVYNVTAAPSPRAYSTIGDAVDPSTRTWALTAVPPTIAPRYKPTAHFVLDSRYISASIMTAIETLLLGGPAAVPGLPTQEQVIIKLAGG